MKINQHIIFTTLKDNRYLVIFSVFVIWMLFFDSNSLIIHLDLSKKISKLEDRKEFYKKEVSDDRKALDEINNDPDMLEKYARERFFMKKKNEEIFIIKEE